MISDNVIRSLRSFCKSNKTSDKPLSALYNMYAVQRNVKSISRIDFEMGLNVLNLRVIQELKRKIGAYRSINGEDSYGKFIKEEQHITKDLWNLLSKQKDSVPVVEKKEESSGNSYERLLPMDWATKSISEKIDFTSKVQHQGFYEYLLGKESRVKEFFDKVKTSPKSALKMYVSVFSFPSDNYSEEAKNLLKCFIEILNQVGRARLQYVECTDPNMVEIREMR